MPVIEPRIDAYIAKSAEFAQPILAKLRQAVRKNCPDAEETIKWSMPCFTYRGKILCSMAAFKQHVSFGFWQHAEILGPDVERDGMGSYGRMASLKDIPAAKTLQTHIQRGMSLIDAAASGAAPKKTVTKKARAVLALPDDFAKAMAKSKAAKTFFDGLPPSAQRDYIEWVVEAKREATRASRITQSVEWLGEGKRRHWKYENC